MDGQVAAGIWYVAFCFETRISVNICGEKISLSVVFYICQIYVFVFDIAQEKKQRSLSTHN